MHSHSPSWIHTLAEWFIWISLGLVLVAVLPLFVNFMVTTKILVILLLGIGLVALFLYQSSLQKTLVFVQHPLTVPLILFGLATGLSTFLATSYPVEDIIGWGGVYLSLVVIALLGSSLLPKDALSRFSSVIVGLTVVVAVSTLLQLVGFGPSRIINALFSAQLPHSSLFDVTGSPFVAAQFFGVVLLALGVSGYYRKQFSSMELIGLATSGIGLATTLYLIMPGKETAPLILPLAASWSVALDTLHNFRAALVGIGPEHYMAAYAQFRPAWINGQSWWNILFTQATNLPLTLVVTTGFVGLVSWLYFLARLVMEGLKRQNLSNPAAVMAVSIGVLNLLVPANIVLMTVQAVALAVWIASQKSSTNVLTIHFFQVYTSGLSNRSLAAGKVIGLALALLVVGAGLYGLGRVYSASYSFYQGSLALAGNDAVTGYTLQQQAVVLNPYLSSYRSGYALTNMGIALALSNKADLTAEEQAQVTQLVQQSIREARAATVLRPDLASNWQMLAQIYRNLIGTAEGADQWTITSYVSAIERAPTDPQLRLELGQVFFQLQQYQQAVSLFSQAAELKPDLVNAYYNGANALKAMGELEAAEQAYQKTLTLLPSDSDDYLAASQELEALQAQIAEQAEEEAANGGADEETETTDNTLNLPSIIDQNLEQQNQEVVNQPGTEDLSVNEPIPTPVPSPSASPNPSPASQ